MTSGFRIVAPFLRHVKVKSRRFSLVSSDQLNVVVRLHVRLFAAYYAQVDFVRLPTMHFPALSRSPVRPTELAVPRSSSYVAQNELNGNRHLQTKCFVCPICTFQNYCLLEYLIPIPLCPSFDFKTEGYFDGSVL